MMKTLLTVAFLLSTSQVFASPLEATVQRAPAAQDVTVVIESLTPLENAFDVTVRGSSTVYHLENAARMSMSKMNALNASLDNGTTVKLRVNGTQIVDILLQ